MSKVSKTEKYILVREKWIPLVEFANISYGELLLLSKIDSLSYNEQNQNKCCTASNKYFADVLHTSERNIQKYYKHLREKELIQTYEERKGNKTTARYTHVQHETINKLLTPHEQMDACSSEPHEQSFMCLGVSHEQLGSTTRTNGYDHTYNRSLPHEQSFTLIREEKRIKENNNNINNIACATKKEILNDFIKDTYVTYKGVNKFQVEFTDEIKSYLKLYNADMDTLSDVQANEMYIGLQEFVSDYVPF